MGFECFHFRIDSFVLDMARNRISATAVRQCIQDFQGDSWAKRYLAHHHYDNVVQLWLIYALRWLRENSEHLLFIYWRTTLGRKSPISGNETDFLVGESQLSTR